MRNTDIGVDRDISRELPCRVFDGFRCERADLLQIDIRRPLEALNVARNRKHGIVIALGDQRVLVMLPQDGFDHLLGGGLADRTGHRNDLRLVQRADIGRDFDIGFADPVRTLQRIGRIRQQEGMRVRARFVADHTQTAAANGHLQHRCRITGRDRGFPPV